MLGDDFPFGFRPIFRGYVSFREGTLLASDISQYQAISESMIFLFPFGGISYYIVPCSLRGYSNITMSECVMAYHVMIDVVASVHFCHCS